MAPSSSEPGGYRPPPHQLAIWLVLGTALVVVIGLLAIRSRNRPDSTRPYPSRSLPADAAAQLLPWEPRDDEYFPCDDCHDDEPANRAPRDLEDEHDELELAHGNLWCLSCHDDRNRERLRLADSSLVHFDDSWQLCTQCHSGKLADWRAGIHGKRTGHWRGPKQYQTCVACHDPHNPPFPSLEPMPPPQQPMVRAPSTTMPDATIPN